MIVNLNGTRNVLSRILLVRRVGEERNVRHNARSRFRVSVALAAEVSAAEGDAQPEKQRYVAYRNRMLRIETGVHGPQLQHAKEQPDA